IRIYEAERDWPRAIAAVQSLNGLVDEPVPQAVHYYCEQAIAALALTPPDMEAAHTALDAAINQAEANDSTNAASPGAMHGNVRMATMRARLAELEGDSRRVHGFPYAVLKQQQEFAGMVAPRLLALHHMEGIETAGITQSQTLYEQYPAQDLFDAIF